MMTIKERVSKALTNYKFQEKGSDINAIIAYAYYLGKHNGVKETCDKAYEVFSKQKERVRKCRYRNMAEAIQGGYDYIYHPDYDSWIHMFDNDETEL